jgi:hypothetical protein
MFFEIFAPLWILIFAHEAGGRACIGGIWLSRMLHNRISVGEWLCFFYHLRKKKMKKKKKKKKKEEEEDST